LKQLENLLGEDVLLVCVPPALAPDRRLLRQRLC
jgi:hypothetical protein